MIKKHQRPTQQAGVPVPGGIVDAEAPLHVSNVMLVCKECSKATRAGCASARTASRCGSASAVERTLTNAYVATRVQEQYKEQVAPALQKEFDYANPMEVPQLTKIVLNIGLGEARENAARARHGLGATSRRSPARSR